MEDVQRAAGAALPPDFESWPKPARWFLRTIVSLPTWKAHGFALCTDDQLAEWRQADPRTIRRMRIEAAKRGEVARVFARRGSTLPDGERVRRGMWILVAGEAYRARSEEASPRSPEVEASPVAFVPPPRSVCPPVPDTLSADRSLDLLDQENINAPCPPEAPPAPAPQPEMEPERSTSFHSDPETKNPEDTSDERAAHAIASHYAKATGRRWHRGIDPPVLAFVLRFVRDMVGSEANKIQRATAVIDRVVDESHRKGSEKPPSLAYVFHPQIFWVRLERLARPPKPQPDAAPMAPSSARPLVRAVDPIDEDPAAIRAAIRESLGLPPETCAAA